MEVTNSESYRDTSVGILGFEGIQEELSEFEKYKHVYITYFSII